LVPAPPGIFLPVTDFHFVCPLSSVHLDKRPGGISRRDPAILCISAARAPPHSTRLSAPQSEPQSDYYGGGEVPAVGMLSTAHPKASPLAFRDLTPFPSHHRPPSAQRSTPRRQRARHDTREAATSRLYIHTQHPTVASTLRPSVALIETASVPECILTYATSSTPRPPHAALRLSRVVQLPVERNAVGHGSARP
jgi:hypothetical protein